MDRRNLMPKPVKLVIVGAGGLGREVLATVRACNEVREQWNVLGFLDSNPHIADREVDGLRVLGGDDWCRKNNDSSLRFFCAIGNSEGRAQVVENLSAMKCKFTSVVHPAVRIPDSVEVGAGTVIMAGTHFTTDAKIGAHSIIYLNCSITHDVDVGDFCLIPSGCNLSGGVVLETGVQLGTGVSILPGRRIGEWAKIGAGSIVTDDIPARSTAVGTPCRVIKQGK
jgi:sugar O-acyltransferase (sialic acid O-acetyltransferase NeuD family)